MQTQNFSMQPQQKEQYIKNEPIFAIFNCIRIHSWMQSEKRIGTTMWYEKPVTLDGNFKTK